MQGGSLKGAAGASALVPVEREFRWGDLINDFLNVSVDKPSQMRYHIANKFCGAVDVRRGSQLPQRGGASSARKPKSGVAVSSPNAAERPREETKVRCGSQLPQRGRASPRGNQSPVRQSASPTRRSVLRGDANIRCGGQISQRGGTPSARQHLPIPQIHQQIVTNGDDYEAAFGGKSISDSI